MNFQVTKIIEVYHQNFDGACCHKFSILKEKHAK